MDVFLNDTQHLNCDPAGWCEQGTYVQTCTRFEYFLVFKSKGCSVVLLYFVALLKFTRQNQQKNIMPNYLVTFAHCLEY